MGGPGTAGYVRLILTQYNLPSKTDTINLAGTEEALIKWSGQEVGVAKAIYGCSQG